jgi:hypothetical protein
MTSKLGILVIGSLLWDDTSVRRSWRDQRLEMRNQLAVKAPIRYGRKSWSRGNTYTMVLSKLIDIPDSRGTAIVVPCRKTISGAEDIIEEARHLWRAERDKQKGTEFSAGWGAVCMLLNPGSEIPDDVRDAWASAVNSENYVNFSAAHGEASVVLPNGLADIAWPETVDGAPLTLDVLLVTQTQPTLINGDYPSPVEIANAWSADRSGNVKYFRNNRQSGIQTFQDHEIERLLNC